jgi:hypothetical protein
MRFGSDAAGSAWGSELLKDPDVAETKLTGVLDIVWAVALAAVTACPWLSPAGTDPPQLQTRAATAATQTMNRGMVIIRAWSAGCSMLLVRLAGYDDGSHAEGSEDDACQSPSKSHPPIVVATQGGINSRNRRVTRLELGRSPLSTRYKKTRALLANAPF